MYESSANILLSIPVLRNEERGELGVAPKRKEEEERERGESGKGVIRIHYSITMFVHRWG